MLQCGTHAGQQKWVQAPPSAVLAAVRCAAGGRTGAARARTRACGGGRVANRAAAPRAQARGQLALLSQGAANESLSEGWQGR